jgi:hypothetical protein
MCSGSITRLCVCMCVCVCVCLQDLPPPGEGDEWLYKLPHKDTKQLLRLALAQQEAETVVSSAPADPKAAAKAAAAAPPAPKVWMGRGKCWHGRDLRGGCERSGPRRAGSPWMQFAVIRRVAKISQTVCSNVIMFLCRHACRAGRAPRAERATRAWVLWRRGRLAPASGRCRQVWLSPRDPLCANRSEGYPSRSTPLGQPAQRTRASSPPATPLPRLPGFTPYDRRQL